jgi:ribosomal-protein-alanine N-acetyltransferase
MDGERASNNLAGKSWPYSPTLTSRDSHTANMSSATFEGPLLTTRRLVLHLPDRSHATAIAAFYRENVAHFARWDPPRPVDFTTRSFWEHRLDQYRDEHAARQAVRFFVRLYDDGSPILDASSVSQRVGGRDRDRDRDARASIPTLPDDHDFAPPIARDAPVVASINFTQIARGPFLACSLGYAIDHRFEGRGLMYEALSACLTHMFVVERLHRISAGYLPVNERSGRLLRKLGFVVEGYARDYLFIDGAWRDHILTALVNPNPVLPELADPALVPPEVVARAGVAPSLGPSAQLAPDGASPTTGMK